MPESLAGLSKLQELDLAGNNLNGSIPAQLGSLHDLKALDLSGNALAGEIPESLGNLTATLKFFNVSYNNLSGAVPASPQAAGTVTACNASTRRRRRWGMTWTTFVSARTDASAMPLTDECVADRSPTARATASSSSSTSGGRETPWVSW